MDNACENAKSIPIVSIDGLCEINILSLDTKVRCSAIMSRKLHRDDSSRFEKFAASNAIDGSDDTYWAGGYDGSQECWIEVTLQEEYVITYLDVKFRYAAEIYLQAIFDGIWVTVKKLTAPASPKDETISLSTCTFVRPTKRLRLIQGKRHPDEQFGNNSNYNLFNCGMEVVNLQLKGFSAPEILLADSEASPAVFFSYNWSLQEVVTRLALETENALGANPWQGINQIGGGDSLMMSTYKGINEAVTMVCCMSKYYATSSNCQHELFITTALDVPVILVHLDDQNEVYQKELPSTNLFLAKIMSNHTKQIELLNAEEKIHKALKESLDLAVAHEITGIENSNPSIKPPVGVAAIAPLYLVANIEEVWNKHHVKIVPISHESAVTELAQTSERRDFAIGRPCKSSGNFYSLPKEWMGLHDSCVTIGSRNGLEDRRASGRWSGARDGDGICWIYVDLGCNVLVDEVRIDQEVACAQGYMINYEKSNSMKLQIDGNLEGEWENIGTYEDGHEGECTTGKIQPVLTCAISVVLTKPYFEGGGFSLWSLEVFGTSNQKPIYSYFFSISPLDMNDWYKCKIIEDAQARMRKKAYKHVGRKGMYSKNMHEDPLDEREAAMNECEAVIVMVSKESVLTNPDNHVISDVTEAMTLKKPIIPIVVDPFTFSRTGDGDKLKWPPTDTTLHSAFKNLIFVDFSNPDKHSISLALLIRILQG